MQIYKFLGRSMKPNTEKVAARLMGIHNGTKLSINEVAIILGINKSTYNSYLRGLALPPLEIAEKVLSLILHNKWVDLEWFYYGDITLYIQDYLQFKGFSHLLEVNSNLHNYIYLLHETENCTTDSGEEVYLSDHDIDLYFKKALLLNLN